MVDFWAGRRVLITGIAGFVGSNLARTLVDAGADVVGLDLTQTSPTLRVLGLGEVPVLVRDVRDTDRVRWAMERGNGQMDWRSPDVVFHLAGQSHIAQAQADPLRTWEINVQGTWAVLEACRNLPQGQIRAVVVASSNHVFGSLPKARVPTCALGHRAYPAVKQDSGRTMWLEDDPCQQTDVYGVSKGCVDLLTRAYGALGVPVVALRHQNAFGEADGHRSHIVTGTICDLLESKIPVILGDGTAIKGYLAVDDVCRAYLRVAEALLTRECAPGIAIHAAGQAMSVLDLVKMIIMISGSNASPEIHGKDASQNGYIEILDDSYLRSMGWQLSDLWEGLQHTFEWFRSHGGMDWVK